MYTVKNVMKFHELLIYTIRNFMKFECTFKLHNLNLISWHYIKFNVFVTEKFLFVYMYMKFNVQGESF